MLIITPMVMWSKGVDVLETGQGPDAFEALALEFKQALSQIVAEAQADATEAAKASDMAHADVGDDVTDRHAVLVAREAAATAKAKAKAAKQAAADEAKVITIVDDLVKRLRAVRTSLDIPYVKG